jgi:hypothetical protein
MYLEISVMIVLRIFGTIREPGTFDQYFFGKSHFQAAKDVAGCIVFKKAEKQH